MSKGAVSDEQRVLRLLRVLREHGTPLPDDGYPLDEYECCADAVIENFGTGADVGISHANRDELATVIQQCASHDHAAHVIANWLSSKDMNGDC